jgi:hypothetical protein
MPALYSFGTGFAQRIVDQQIANQEEETLRERAKLEFDYSIKIADAKRSANSSAEENKLLLKRNRVATSIMTNGGFYQISEEYQKRIYNTLIGMDIATLDQMSKAALEGDLNLVGMLTGRGATIQPAPKSLDALQTHLFNLRIAGIALTDTQQAALDLLRPAKDILNPMATFQKSMYSLVFAGPLGGIITGAPSYEEWVISEEENGWKSIKAALDESLRSTGGIVKSVEAAGEALGQLVEKSRRVVQTPEQAALEDAGADPKPDATIERPTSAAAATTAPVPTQTIEELKGIISTLEKEGVEYSRSGASRSGTIEDLKRAREQLAVLEGEASTEASSLKSDRVLIRQDLLTQLGGVREEDFTQEILEDALNRKFREPGQSISEARFVEELREQAREAIDGGTTPEVVIKFIMKKFKLNRPTVMIIMNNV